MKSRPIERWTLRELINGSERICRDIHEHMNTDYAPTLREVAELLRPHKHRKLEVSDRSICTALARLEKSEGYATELMDHLEEVLRAIQSHAEREVT